MKPEQKTVCCLQCHLRARAHIALFFGQLCCWSAEIKCLHAEGEKRCKCVLSLWQQYLYNCRCVIDTAICAFPSTSFLFDIKTSEQGRCQFTSWPLGDKKIQWTFSPSPGKRKKSASLKSWWIFNSEGGVFGKKMLGTFLWTAACCCRRLLLIRVTVEKDATWTLALKANISTWCNVSSIIQ